MRRVGGGVGASSLRHTPPPDIVLPSISPQILIRCLLFACTQGSASPFCLSSLSLPLPPSPFLETCKSPPRCISGEPWPGFLGNLRRLPEHLFHTLGRLLSEFPPSHQSHCSCTDLATPLSQGNVSLACRVPSPVVKPYLIPSLSRSEGPGPPSLERVFPIRDC